MRYMTSDRLGFTKDHVIIIQRTDLLNDKTKAFKNELLKIPGVEKISGASSLPGIQNYFGVSWLKQGETVPMVGRGIITDNEHAETLGLQLKEGRFFFERFSNRLINGCTE
jgi:putative ABC transport system permease protein